MKCPICTEDLKMADRQGIEIDYCPKCRGVWLDRGELDKIIERSATVATATPAQPAAVPGNTYDSYDNRSNEYRAKQRHDKDDYHHKKRKSFLGDLFDF